MNEKALDILAGYFDPESADADWRKSLWNSSTEYRESIRDGWAALLRTRTLSLMEFYDLTRTDLEYETEDQVYADIAKAYEHLFGEPAPTYQGS
ncbi:hypothetical protein [Microlunatus speluncae]|uniref:hypothetical protein n=1 Tax=Microlunatus speluncae TaxID=2594267 RepID=UPI0012661CDB|nr:hypothetical protein [Microlunatus speluncae]